MNFGQRLHRLRQEKGLSQTQLAKELGFSQAAIGYWERGEKAPSMDAVNIIAGFFHVSINWLYGIEEPDATESEFRKACQWLEDAEISIDAPDQDDGLQQYYLHFENDGILEISCKMDKTDIIHLVNECVNDANKTRDDIAIKYIKRALKSQK